VGGWGGRKMKVQWDEEGAVNKRGGDGRGKEERRGGGVGGRYGGEVEGGETRQQGSREWRTGGRGDEGWGGEKVKGP